jgi:hypothetical protein
MKKLVSLAVSAVSAFTLVSSFSAKAIDKSYCPKLYFKASKVDGIHPQTNKRVYVDLNELKGDVSFDVSTYVDDSYKMLSQIFCKWDTTDEFIKLSDLRDPETSGVTRAYKNQPGLTTHANDNFMSVTYNTTRGDAFAVNGTNSDTYPIAMFTAKLASNVTIGNHVIKFYTKDEPLEANNEVDYTMLSMNDGTDKIIAPVPTQNDAESLTIAVSDRKLGDLDDSPTYTADDASSALRAFTKLSSKQDSGFDTSQMAAADVDGDGRISASDASYILKYYTYLSSNGTQSIYDYYGY